MANYVYGKVLSKEEKNDLVTKVYKYMEDNGLSVQALADHIGYSKYSVYKFLEDNSRANKFIAAALLKELTQN